jgi:hypothetical protein
VKYLSSKGVILFHDCNPVSEAAADPEARSPEEMQQKFPGTNAEWNGDVWKTIVHIRSQYPDFETVVLDCDFGVGVAWRQKTQQPLSYSPVQIQNMTYSDLDKNRTSLLNLKKPEYLDEILGKL